MTPSEKLLKIAQNEQLVANANAELEEALYSKSEGGKSWYDTLWDNLQQNGKRAHYSYAFSYTGWNDKVYNPKYPIIPTSTNGIAYMFTWNQAITDTKVPITAFGSAQNAFYSCKELKRIIKLIFDGTTNVNNMLYYCIKLEELYAEGKLDLSLNVQHSPLNKASIISLVNVLSETAEGQTMTFNLAAVNKAFETSEGANDGSTSAEWDTLQNTKSNWTIKAV